MIFMVCSTLPAKHPLRAFVEWDVKEGQELDGFLGPLQISERLLFMCNSEILYKISFWEKKSSLASQVKDKHFSNLRAVTLHV